MDNDFTGCAQYEKIFQKTKGGKVGMHALYVKD